MTRYSNDQLKQDLLSGETNYSKLAKQYSITRSTIRSYAERLNIKIQNHTRRIHTFDTQYFKSIDTNEKAYVLGFIYADGCNTRKGLQIGIKSDDKTVLDFISAQLKSTYPLRVVSPFKNTWSVKHELRIKSLQLSEDLTDIGCPPNKSTILSFPTFLSELLIPHFIRGYFDGDGSLGYHQNSWRVAITCASIDFIVPLKNYLHNQGIELNLYTNSKNGCYSLQSSKRIDIQSLVKLMYTKSDFGMPRKKTSALACLNSGKGG